MPTERKVFPEPSLLQRGRGDFAAEMVSPVHSPSPVVSLQRGRGDFAAEMVDNVTLATTHQIASTGPRRFRRGDLLLATVA